MKPWPIFSVEVDGYAPEIFTGATKAKATWRAYQAFTEHRSYSFADWIAITRVRRLERLPASHDDVYELVEAQYGIRPRIGETLLIGASLGRPAREALVIYPGRYTSMVHMADGNGGSFLVHPIDVRRPHG